MSEVWKPVVGYEGYYEVSSYGRVRRSVGGGNGAGLTWKGRVRILTTNKRGYQKLNLSKEVEKRSHSVHVLVAEAFHGPKPKDKDVAAHWDGNPGNNVVKNIRWATHKENNDDSWRHGTKGPGELNSNCKLTAVVVIEIRNRISAGQKGPAIARELNVSLPNVYAIKHRRSWDHI